MISEISDGETSDDDELGGLGEHFLLRIAIQVHEERRFLEGLRADLRRRKQLLAER